MNQINRYEIPLAKDIMTKKVVTVSPNLMIGEVVKLFNRNKISAAPVVNNNNKVIGLISEKDLLKELASESFHYEETPETFPATVKSKMITEVISLTPELDVFEIVQIFSDNNLRHAPVLGYDRKLLGIIARRDLLKALEKLIDETGEIADAERSSKVSYWKEKFLYY